MKISVISPVYGAASLLRELVDQIEKYISVITNDYEIILVEDHSPDDSQRIIRDICKDDKCVKGVFHSRNFGQQYAIHTGFTIAKGDYIITMDCDLQDNPACIIDLFNKCNEGYDIVFASRQNRHDGLIKKLGSKVFNKTLGFLTDTIQDESIANFVIYRKKVVEAMLTMGDYRKYYPFMNHWVGFTTYKLPVPHAERADGESSSYSLKKRIELALNTAVALSTKPLRLIIYIGSIITLLSFVSATVIILNYLFGSLVVSGWFTLFVSMWFVFGMMMITLGVVAIYLGSIFEQTKNRPITIVSEVLNND